MVWISIWSSDFKSTNLDTCGVGASTGVGRSDSMVASAGIDTAFNALFLACLSFDVTMTKQSLRHKCQLGGGLAAAMLQ